MNLSNLIVHVGSFTFGDKSKKYPYKMVRNVDLKESIKKLKSKTALIPKEYQKLFNMRIDKLFGDALCTDSAEVKE